MFSFISNFKHKQEVLESKDEILSGEIIAAMHELGFVSINFFSNAADYQAIKFKSPQEKTLFALTIILDRKTGGGSVQQALIGSKGILTFEAEIKNYLADPDDLIKMYQTDFANLLKIPLFGDIRLNHQLNSVFATKKIFIDLDKYILKGENERRRLKELLKSTIDELKEKLLPFKK